MKVRLYRRTGFASQLCDLLYGAIIREVERDEDASFRGKLFHVLVYEPQCLTPQSDLFRVLDCKTEALLEAVQVFGAVFKKYGCLPSQLPESDERTVGHDPCEPCLHGRVAAKLLHRHPGGAEGSVDYVFRLRLISQN